MISAIKLKVFYLIPLAFYFVSSFSQTNTTDNTFSEIEKLYGGNQIPLNGKLGDYLPGRDVNHPFFLLEDYQSGNITIHDSEYRDIKLRYNIFNQTIEVLYTDPRNAVFGLLPPPDFITTFDIGERTFGKYNFDDRNMFYQEIYANKIRCLYLWTKKRSESSENRSYSRFEYHQSKRKSYILVNSKLISYTGNSSYIKIFPKKYKIQIKEFIKEHDINLKKSNDSLIAELVAYCENLPEL